MGEVGLVRKEGKHGRLQDLGVFGDVIHGGKRRRNLGFLQSLNDVLGPIRYGSRTFRHLRRLLGTRLGRLLDGWLDRRFGNRLPLRRKDLFRRGRLRGRRGRLNIGHLTVMVQNILLGIQGTSRVLHEGQISVVFFTDLRHRVIQGWKSNRK